MYYSDPYEVQSVGNEIVSRILAEVGKQQSATAWTEAVYKALRDLGSAKRWKIHPPERPYKGEYLCDFTLHEEGYGCRVACESQWMNWRREHRAELEWAFDKLVGVKSDLKVFIFEGDESDWRQVVHRYLEGSGQILEGEAHLALRWSYDRFHRSFWIAPHSGENRSIEFQVFECTPNQ